jgi:hypothetical protein
MPITLSLAVLVVVAFFDFPAEHWDHLRTSNPIESVFATVRHRTVRTKGSLSQKDSQANGLQTCLGGGKDLATTKGSKPVAQARRRSQIPKRCRGHRDAGQPRRLINPVTQIPA